MKFLSILMIACIVFLSSFAGVAKTIPAAAKMDCCKKMAGKKGCSGKQANHPGDGCEKPGCAMLFSCSLCGFIPVMPLELKLNVPKSLTKPVILYKIGDIAAYHEADWKPPKST
jgi:hypothetical protein